MKRAVGWLSVVLLFALALAVAATAAPIPVTAAPAACTAAAASTTTDAAPDAECYAPPQCTSSFFGPIQTVRSAEVIGQVICSNTTEIAGWLFLYRDGTLYNESPFSGEGDSASGTSSAPCKGTATWLAVMTWTATGQGGSASFSNSRQNLLTCS
jgi:hypothetical protein